MHRFVSGSARGLAVVALLALGARPVLAHPEPPGPILDVANPSPGDLLTPGAMFLEGIAYDDSAEHGSGIDRVSVFLGDRDEGGIFLGDATLGLHSPQSVDGGDAQFSRAGWRLRTPVLNGVGQHQDLTVYARSSVSGAETVEVIPVIVGESGGGSGGSED
jgi:hypothetical protein